MLPMVPDMPRRARARAMGEIISITERIKDAQILADRVKEIVSRVREEEAQWKESEKVKGAQ